MKDCAYFIPGYTGFCPELREHFGQTYGHATRHIIQKKPHLKERLAPVHYRYRRFERTKGTSGKHLNQERDKCDNTKSKNRNGIYDAGKTKYRTDRDIAEAGKKIHDQVYGDGDMHQEKCCRNCERVYPFERKYASTYADEDRIQNIDRECIPPKYVFVKGFAECVQPEAWTSESRQKMWRADCPGAISPCAHVNEYSELYNPAKKSFVPMSHVHLKVYHPIDCGHIKDAESGGGYKMRKGQQVRPHRYGGVIPKYTGHVPGMQFSFGEAYGPVSDRLLRKHHDRMKELKIKS